MTWNITILMKKETHFRLVYLEHVKLPSKHPGWNKRWGKVRRHIICCACMKRLKVRLNWLYLFCFYFSSSSIYCKFYLPGAWAISPKKVLFPAFEMYFKREYRKIFACFHVMKIGGGAKLTYDLLLYPFDKVLEVNHIRLFYAVIMPST